MGAVANAVTLMGDFTFKQYCQAVCVYTATAVTQEAGTVNKHDERLALAVKVLDNPEYLTNRMVAMLATKQSIATLGTTLGDGADISEAALIAGAADVWTTLALVDAV